MSGGAMSSEAERLIEAAEAMTRGEILTGLERKADPRHTALIVVDVQNDFCAEGGMMDDEGRDLGAVQAMAGRLPRLIEQARRAGAMVIYIQSVYSAEGNPYLSPSWLEQAGRRRGRSYTQRPVCAAGSWEGDFYGEISPAGDEPIIHKHRFSAFHNTDLDTILRANEIKTLVMAGVASNVCVETTAREGFVRDYYIVFLSDGSATYSETDHQATLHVIDSYFGEIATVDELVELWDGGDGEPEAE